MRNYKIIEPAALVLLLAQGLLQGCAPSPATSLSPVAVAPATAAVEYRNAEYGFVFSLPERWEGYSTTTSHWEGFTQAGSQGDVLVEQGPELSIHHPSSTSLQPRQAIPIMVFTIEQWDSLQGGRWWASAAPILPLELARNGSYVFALPPRYNYAMLEGWEEVDEILQGDPIRTFEPSTL